MKKYRVWARVVVGVGFEPIEATSAEDAVKRHMTTWPGIEIAWLIDLHGGVSRGPRVQDRVANLQYEESTAPLEFMVDAVNEAGVNEDDYSSTTYWELDEKEQPRLIEKASTEEWSVVTETEDAVLLRCPNGHEFLLDDEVDECWREEDRVDFPRCARCGAWYADSPYGRRFAE